MSKVTNEEIMEDVKPTTEELQTEVGINEAEILRALTQSDTADETTTIEVKFRSVVFSFRIRALTEREWDDCREKCTKYSKNRRLGNLRLPERTDTVKYHTLLIYTATIPEDKAKLWDNKTLWNAVDAVTGTDMVDKLIPMAGKKQAIVGEIERLSGFDEEDNEAYNETVKN